MNLSLASRILAVRGGELKNAFAAKYKKVMLQNKNLN